MAGRRAAVAFAGLAVLLIASGFPTPAAAQTIEGTTSDLERVVPYEYRGDVREWAKLPAAPSRPIVYWREMPEPPRTKRPPAPRTMDDWLNLVPSLSTLTLAPMPAPVQDF